MIRHFKKVWAEPAIMIDENPWIVGFYYGLAVYLFLSLLQPFGISNDTSLYKFVYLVGYLLIAVLGVAIPYYVMPLLCHDFCNEDLWTYGREIVTTIFTLALISLGNLFYPVVLGWAPLSWNLTWIVVSQTILVFLAVYSIKLWLNNKVLKKNLAKAIDLNKHINSDGGRISRSIKERMPISLCGIGKNANVEIDAENLLFVESEKNYCKIVYLQDGYCKERMLRCTISSIEEQLSAFPSAVRCHRAFIVNVKYICSVEGNSSGYKLLLDGTDINVPVSRSYTSSVLSMIEAVV